MTALASAAPPSTRSLGRSLSRNGWSIGVWLLGAGLIAWYSTLIPVFGDFQITSISKNSLPLIFLAIGQGVIVIGGGIDLSIGSLLLLSSVTAARTMDGQSFVVVLLLAVLIIIGTAIANGLAGWVIWRSKVPDIVVTLATSYIWSGVALTILKSPGGGTAPRFRWLFTGSQSGIGTNWIMPILMIVFPALVLLWVMRRTVTGLAIYATGNDPVASEFAGVDVRRAKISSYAIGGAMAAMAGLATIAITGTGDPRFSIGANATLNTVAAIVLGGIALTGGVGSIIGVVAAAITLVVLTPFLTALGVDANNAQVVEGVLIAAVVMVGGLTALRRERAS